MKTDNELIAEFMGFEVTDNMPVTRQRIYSLPYVDTSLGNPYFGPHRSEQMNFDSDWSWIMPVLEKIQNLDEPFAITLGYGHMSNLGISSHYTYCHIENWKNEEVVGYSGAPTLIEAVHKSVVEFVKWYNSQLTSNQQPSDSANNSSSLK